MKASIQVIALFLIFSFSAQDIFAQTKLSVQGVIRKSDGNAVEDGEYAVTFNLYDTLTSGNLLWTETQSQLNVTSGIYSTILGEVNPLDLPFDQFYFLTLTIDGEELLPRAPLTTSPYANALIGFDNAFPSSGNVGIGTLNATEKLDVQGNVNVQNTLFTDDINVTGGITVPNNQIDIDATHVRVYSPGESKFTVKNSTGGGTLQMYVSALNEAFLYNTVGTAFILGSSNSEQMRLHANGRVSLGGAVASANEALHVLGHAYKSSGGSSWTNSSDRRLKKNINDFHDGLDLIEKIRPVTYQYNGKEGLNPDEEYVGIIAQEMREIAPYMISEYKGQDGNDYLKYDESALIYIVVNAMQEQQAQIEELISENTELKQKLKNQEEKTNAKLSVLEAKLNDIIEKQSLTKL